MFHATNISFGIFFNTVEIMIEFSTEKEHDEKLM